jgi:hypothetical protein
VDAQGASGVGAAHDLVLSPPETGDATCPNCGLGMFLSESGQVGRYPTPGWEPGRIQGWKRPEG